MPTGPAARITDPVLHPLPGILQPGPGSPTVLIGGLPAWRGVSAAAAAAIQAAKAVSDAAIHVAEAATLAAAGTPGAAGRQGRRGGREGDRRGQHGLDDHRRRRRRRHPCLRRRRCRSRRTGRASSSTARRRCSSTSCRPAGVGDTIIEARRPAEQDRDGPADGDHRRLTAAGPASEGTSMARRSVSDRAEAALRALPPSAPSSAIVGRSGAGARVTAALATAMSPRCSAIVALAARSGPPLARPLSLPRQT